MSVPQYIEKYLTKQNLSDWKIEFTGDRLFNNIIVIPATDEYNNIKNLFLSLSLNDPKIISDTLIVVVVNNKVSENKNIILENQNTLTYLRNEANSENDFLNLGIVDASSSGKWLPHNNGGVGFARKIGLDLALRYFDYSADQKNILILLDADCTVSNNYLHAIIENFSKKNIQAGVINYEHLLTNNINQNAAIINYEIFLRYYVLGLSYANSAFAYHSIGSTIICDVVSYVKVGGMNKKKAGEDFYFLEKLAKINRIASIQEATVYPSARISERVPFGTGPRVKRFLNSSQNSYLLYSPQTFVILKQWLIEFGKSSSTESWISRILHEAKCINHELFDFLISQNFAKDWENILNNSKSEDQVKKQKIIWMDGFKTMKLIHYLRDKSFPNINMFSALNELFDKLNFRFDFKTAEQIPSIDTQIKYLNFLRKLSHVDL